jgi:EAL domain-containing protein (putative c-di-GMP-specific phosphodiesterase class I)
VTLTDDDRLAHELRGALDRHELDVWYQPEVEVDGRKVVALEALLRWHHASGELYDAGRFVGVAEATGLIVPIGEWALVRACEQAVVWRTLLGHAPPVLRVNLSEPQVAAAGLLDALDAALATGLAPGGLSLELDEAALLLGIADPVVAANLRGIHERGVALVVDRFGLGDGSLGAFDGLGGARRLPVSALKLDRGVVARVTDDDATRRLVAAVVAAARGAGVDVIALGVEEQAQAELLTELGLTAATGYLFSEAVPAASIAELLLITT